MPSRKRCKCCSDLFVPRPQCKNQAYCVKEACRKASKKNSQAKWLDKNPDHFKGNAHVLRVQQWRSRNEGYWRRQNGSSGKKTSEPLQDLSNSQPAEDKKDNVKNAKQSDFALQDFWISQISILYGFISKFTEEPLQETLDSFLHNLQNSGSEILGIRSEVSFTELTRRYRNEAKENTTRTGSDPPGARAL